MRVLLVEVFFMMITFPFCKIVISIHASLDGRVAVPEGDVRGFTHNCSSSPSFVHVGEYIRRDVVRVTAPHGRRFLPHSPLTDALALPPPVWMAALFRARRAWRR